MPWLTLAFTSVAVLAADVTTKALATDRLEGGRVVELPFGVQLEYGENSGIAFGWLAGDGGLVLVAASTALLGLAVILLRSRACVAAVPIAVLVGGALANLVDRAGDGAVTDFIDLGSWPAFNLADVAITAGVALLALAFMGTPGSSTLDPGPDRHGRGED